MTLDFCRKCQIDTEHYVNGRCAPCRRASQRAYFRSNPEEHRRRQAQWRSKNRSYANKKSREWVEANPERVRRYRINRYQAKKDQIRAQQASYRKANLDSVRQRSAEWRRSNPEKIRDADLRRKFGIDLETYKQMSQQQRGVCYICSSKEKSLFRGKVFALAVDHSHDSGKVRKLLCARCNWVLGVVEDSGDLLRRMADYLEDHKK